MIIIASVNQPSTRVFNIFDQVLASFYSQPLHDLHFPIASFPPVFMYAHSYYETRSTFYVTIGNATVDPKNAAFRRSRQVILLSTGRTMYFGPAVDSLEHFARLGYKPVGLVNPADYLIEVYAFRSQYQLLYRCGGVLFIGVATQGTLQCWCEKCVQHLMYFV